MRAVFTRDQPMNCTTLKEYMDRYGPLVADRAKQAFEPLHVPAADPVIRLELHRPLLPAQAHVVTAAVKTLRRQKAVFLCCECGTGKSQMGACTVHAHAAGRPYRAIVMCPPHLVETWKQELGRVFHEGAVEVRILENWKELVSYPRQKPSKPCWLIMGETVAKNGPYWRAAAVKDNRGVLRCPDCGAQLRGKNGGEGNFLGMKDLERSRKQCSAEIIVGFDKDGNPVTRPCEAALWQYVGTDAVWAPADYVHKQMRGVFDYLVCDEVHEEKSESSARANALGALVASCRKVVAMTGTLIGGRAGHVRSLLFRLCPKSLRSENLTWEDDMEFSRRYGRVDTITTERTGSTDDNRRSNGKSVSKRQVEQPGIMPTLYGRHLIGNTIFLSLKDVAADLPQYDEQPIPVRMSPSLEEPYRKMEGELKEAVAKLLRRGNHQLLSGMLHGLLAYPDYPYDWEPIGYVAKNGSGGRFVPVSTPASLDKTTLWPKERKLLEILAQEKAQGRQCWVFCVYTSTHPVLERLEKVVKDAGFTVKVLDAEKVPTRSRSAWIARNAPGTDVIISHPQPVRTGLTLFDASGAHNFPSLIFYETGYDLFTLRQASRRSWRIGQRLPCRVYYLYYKETMQARAMSLMAQKLEASLALEGQFSTEGLAAMSADSGSLTMELARSLVENLDFGNVDRVWGHPLPERLRSNSEAFDINCGLSPTSRGRAKAKSIQGRRCFGQMLLFVP